MDDPSFTVGGGVLDSGLADLETELATWYTWNVLADLAKHSWVQTAIRQQGGIGMLAMERVA
jgi:hypothetical protein